MPCCETAFNLLPPRTPVVEGDEVPADNGVPAGAAVEAADEQRSGSSSLKPTHPTRHHRPFPVQPLSVLVTTFHARAFDRDRSTSLPYQFFANYLWLLALKAQF